MQMRETYVKRNLYKIPLDGLRTKDRCFHCNGGVHYRQNMTVKGLCEKGKAEIRVAQTVQWKRVGDRGRNGMDAVKRLSFHTPGSSSPARCS